MRSRGIFAVFNQPTETLCQCFIVRPSECTLPPWPKGLWFRVECVYTSAHTLDLLHARYTVCTRSRYVLTRLVREFDSNSTDFRRSPVIALNSGGISRDI